MEPRYNREEIARQGIYGREVLPCLNPGDEGKFALVDVEIVEPPTICTPIELFTE